MGGGVKGLKPSSGYDVGTMQKAQHNNWMMETTRPHHVFPIPNQSFLSIQINILIDFNSSSAAIFSLYISTIEVAIDLYDQTALNKSIRIPIALDARRIAAKVASHFKGFIVGSLNNKNHVRKLKITLSEKNRYSYAIIETISAILLSNSHTRKLFILLGRGRSSFN